MFYTFAKFLIRLVAWLLFPREVYFADHMPQEGACIVCANHLSLTDPVLIALSVKRKIRFIAKKEIFRVPIFDKLLRLLGAFPVDRQARDVSAVRTCLSVLKQQKVLGIFPEGTRIRPGVQSEGKAGVSLIAKKSSAWIVPVRIKPKYGRFKLFCKTEIIFGTPFHYDDLGMDKDYENASKEIMRRIYMLGEEREV